MPNQSATENDKNAKILELQEELARLYDKHNSVVVLQSSLNQKDSVIQNLRGKLAEEAASNSQELMVENARLKATIHSYEQKEVQLEQLRSELAILKNATASDGSGGGSEHGASRSGVIVLGMHRSGTSIVGGLMTKMGLNTGGPLIQPNFDNEKGFFERIDVVLQNDYIMKRQNVHYAFNTYKYDALVGLKDVLNLQDDKFFAEGRRALSFLNNDQNAPWMLKDPRLCITLRTWTPLLTRVPAVLFTYRNPMDVAMSMHKRETEHFPIAKGLKLWYVYNKRAIQQSGDLCRVRTSHRLVMLQPQEEMNKIVSGLRRCGVAVPHEVSSSDVKSFVDTSLQHGRTSLLDTLCADPSVDFSNILPPAESWVTTDEGHLRVYRSSVRAYCDMESGAAFAPNYKWDDTIRDN